MDDWLMDTSATYSEGEETRISLKISVPDMSLATRADMPEGADFEVNSLWVGIFNANSGKCTYAAFHKEIPTKHTPFIDLENIKTETGLSYIVAVGNPEDNYGYHPSKSTGNKLNRTELTELLPSSATPDFTWDDYQSIAIRQLDLGDVNTPIGNLVMSGIYYDSESDPLAKSWETLNYTPVNIQQSRKLPGAIHLRRLISQVKFHIEAIPYDGENNLKKEEVTDEDGNKYRRRIISITPQSYQVRNVPYTSWLHERKGASNPDDIASGEFSATNSGDVIRLNSSSISYTTDGAMALRPNYRSSAWFNGSDYIIPHYDTNVDGTQKEEPTYFTFDFWMLENKRWAVYDLEKDYDKREKESKKKAVENNDYYETNTGIYYALCGGDENTPPVETMNNTAAFVEIRCRIVYTDPGLDAIQQEDDYKDVQYRSADAVYTVHLGGINQDWNDFTHRRNHIYTYKIKVMDVDRIIVEARADTEDRPGIEGVVTDVVNPPFEVDAHYALVNIKLSNLERTGGGIDVNGEMNDGSLTNDKINGGGTYKNGVFPFRIRYYDKDNLAHFIDQENLNEYMDDPEMRLYWTWIELRPTTDSLTLAKYKPYWDRTGAKPEYADGETFRLNEVHDIKNYPGKLTSKKDDNEERRTDEKDTIERWYTVFINEYVYETSLNEDTDDNNQPINNWKKYVNLSPRMCWINTLFRSSKDDESSYIRSKYVVRQQSIQTFYDIPEGHNGDAIDAIGMEHINETFGFNLRWDGVMTAYSSYPYDDQTTPTAHDIKNNNGRHNTLLYIAGTPTSDNSGNNKGTRGEKWSDYMSEERLQLIDEINPNFNQRDVTYQLLDAAYLPEGNKKREPYYVPAIRTYEGGDFLRPFSDINSKYFLRILDACMNRNRDNNGDGKIDKDEIRWYVPASSEIIDLVLGRNSVETPLLDYGQNYALNSPRNYEIEQSHQANTRFHYATSNQRVLWAEEGATINPQVDVRTGAGTGWNLPPLNVRCVRALGTDLTTDKNADLSPAFSVDNLNAPTKIIPTYYEQKNQRAYTANAIEPHQETSTLNRLSYNGFEFSKQLYEIPSSNVEISIEEKNVYLAGYYAGGSYEGEYLGTDAPLDPNWAKENGNPKLLEKGRLFKTNNGNGYYYRAKPGTKHNDWVFGNIVIKNDGKVIFREAGWYKIDKKQYLTNSEYSKSNVNDSEYVYADEMWTGGTTHMAGWYKPDVLKGRYDTAQEDGGTVLWEDYTLYDEMYPAGYYWPDPKSRKDEKINDAYEYFEGPLGTVWNKGGNYYLMGSASKEYVFGYAYYEGANGQKWGDGFDGTPDSYFAVDFNANGDNAWVRGFWSGEQLQPGWYARGELITYGELPEPGVQYPNNLPRFNTDVNIGEGQPVPNGYYYADESQLGNEGKAGYQYYPAWNIGGEYYPTGWYRIVEYSPNEPANKDGYIYLDEISDDFGNGGRYEADFSIWSETPKPGYGQIEDDKAEIEIWTEDFKPGYYADGGYGDFICTDPPLDESAKWLSGKSVPTGNFTKKTVRAGGTQTDGEYLFVYNEGTFVENHSATLKIANDKCKELDTGTGRKGWRLPNLKEAALIKIAMDNAGLYKQNGLTHKKDQQSGYDIGNFLACTYREYGVDGAQSRDDKTGYYTGVYFAEAGDEVQAGDWLNDDGRTVLGRICCITTGQNRHYYIRCVRDLESSGD